MEEQMNSSLANNHDHRGPLPKLPWVMKQTWRHTLFAHYPVKRGILRKLVPAILPLDTYQDTCWVSVVPYITTSMHLRLLPPIPGTSTFAGFNVRTYVILNGKLASRKLSKNLLPITISSYGDEIKKGR